MKLIKWELLVLFAFLFFTINSFAQSIAAGSSHSLAICTDNTVSSWGTNTYGELGNNTTVQSLTPVAVLGLNNVIAVAGAGSNSFSFALRNDGTLWGWGSNGYGSLGDNTTVDRWTPVQVVGLGSVTSIVIENSHALALKSDGTVWAWGYNGNGEIGDNTTVNRMSPLQVNGLSGIIDIAVGTGHSVALKSNGTVWSWGYNLYGQLGDNSTVEKWTPIQTLGLSGITSIAAGDYHDLALKSDGTVWAWGINDHGEIGDNTSITRKTPVQITALTGVAALAAGHEHSHALISDGTVRGWGWNFFGMVGDNTSADRITPVQVSGLSGVTSISTSGTSSLALKNDGTIWANGWNLFGEIGDNSTSLRISPVQTLNLCMVMQSLPIELLYFWAIPIKETGDTYRVECKWSTVTETNNHFFSLERSQDAYTFSEIEQVQSAAPGGYSNIPLYYSRYDEHPFTGVSYYRLKQVDYNGQYKYSDIRSVYIGITDIISIYPNPSFDGYIQYAVGSELGGEVTVQLIDVLGKEVTTRKETFEKGINTKQLSTASLTSGTYLMRITQGDKEKVQKQFLIK